MPGPVDSTGVVHGVSALGWPNVELRAELERVLDRPGYPVGVDNDATLGAIAEHRYGAFAGTAHLAYFAGPPGGGVGLINVGAPLRGLNGYSGAFGRWSVDPVGWTAGCLDAATGLEALVGRSGADPGPGAARQVEIERLVRQAGAGERDTLTRLADVGTRLGHAVAVLVDLLNPAAVLLGGEYARLAPWLLPAAEHEFRRRAVTPNADALRMAASKLGYAAPVLGAAAVPLNAIDSGGCVEN
jgi:predicted NBD/HSP70 family sugar kinase